MNQKIKSSINRGSPLAGTWRAMAMTCLLSLAVQAQNAPATLDLHRAEMKFRVMSLRDENGKIPPNALLNAVRQAQQMQYDPRAWPGRRSAGNSAALESGTAGVSSNAWTWLGPGNIGGRIRSILINPLATNTMWLGGVDGGVWKTLNGGASWFPLNDFMANLAVVTLVMDPTDANVIYAGTGEGTYNADAVQGAGIFKTTDGGSTWTQLAATANSSFYYVNRLSVCPTNSLILLAATGTGIWRSTDGGASWSERYNSSGMEDISFDPSGGKAIASGNSGQLMYSTDAGVTWNNASGISIFNRIEVAYAASSPNIVYASADNNSGEVYVSSDGGQTYNYISNPQHLSGQGWYDNCIWVDPTNPNVVVIGGTDLYRSTDGGNTWTDIGGYSGSVHPDQHVLISMPGYNGTTIRTLFVGNDGGFFRAADIYTVSSSSGWTTLNNNLGITQFYGAAGNNTSGTLIGGAQDNGTLRDAVNGGTGGWTSMFGGDGGDCAADQSDPNYFYGEYVYLQIHRSSNGGLSSSYITGGLGDAGLPDSNGVRQAFFPPDSKTLPGNDPDGGSPSGAPDSAANFIAPFILDPNNFNTLLAGGSNLWRSVNVKAATPTWTNIKPGANGSFISAIAVAKGNSDIIWVGHDDGDVYSTANGTAANPTWTRRDLGSPNLPNRECTRLTIDPNNFNKVYATFGGYSSDNVYRTTDGGATWTDLAAGLPAAPVNSLVLAPFNSNFIYVGMDVGVFASADGGATWSAGNVGAANVAVDELFWMNNYLVAATHGRGLFKTLVSQGPIVNLTSAALTSENCPPGNGAIDPGETVGISFTLTNLVGISTTNLVATLLPGNGVTFPGAPQNYGALIGGGAAGTKIFSLTATGACGGTLTATLQLNDGTNNLGTVSSVFPLGVASVPVVQNFDGVTAPTFPSGWTVSWTGAGAAWVTTTATSDSAPNSAFATDPSAVSDNRLTSPSFMINTTNAQLTFRNDYNSENSYDGGVLEIAINGGAFTDILAAGGSFAANGYSQTISSSYGNPLAGRQAWSGSSGGFVTTTVNLPASAAGQSVQLRWRFGSDTSVGITGWYVDTITVKDGYACCVGQPVFQSITRSGGNVNLVWTAISGMKYRIQYKSDLNSSTWTDVAGDVTASGDTASKMDVGVADAQRFYRLEVIP